MKIIDLKEVKDLTFAEIFKKITGRELGKIQIVGDCLICGKHNAPMDHKCKV